MSDVSAERSAKFQRLWVVPLVVVLVVFLLEFETPGIRIRPSLLTIALAIFALFLSAQAVLRWALILFVPVVLTLMFVPNNGVYETPGFVVLRSAVASGSLRSAPTFPLSYPTLRAPRASVRSLSSHSPRFTIQHSKSIIKHRPSRTRSVPLYHSTFKIQN